MLVASVFSCSGAGNRPGIKSNQTSEKMIKKGTYAYDRRFLEKHIDIRELSDPGGTGSLLVSAGCQGRVMTSTTEGDSGFSFGWINYELISSGQVKEHINAYGGEDRIWLGPEGGQFALFFEQGVPFEFEHWFTPPEIDTEPFEYKGGDSQHASFSREMNLINYSGTRFRLRVERTIRIVDKAGTEEILSLEIPKNVDYLGYLSDNSITNLGAAPWTRKSGMLSIWILGMYKPSPEAVIVIPYKTDKQGGTGPVMNDEYFGKIPEERLVSENGIIYFKADGKERGKIGIGPGRITPFAGAYDAGNQMLTVVNFSFDPDVRDYVNSMWKLQEEPFRGDVLNAYNDGPLGDGSQMGPFYELESSSSAAGLKPGDTMRHVHRTFHFTGSRKGLDKICRHIFHVSLQEIEKKLHV